jgi:hypothetical protein
MKISAFLIGAILSVASFGAVDMPLLSHFISTLEIPTDVPSKVLRMELDVTGDGRPELFLGTTYLGGNFGNAWTVYSPGDDGRYRSLGQLTFHYEGFYYAADASRFCVYVRASAQEGGFTCYHTSANGFEEMDGASGVDDDLAVEDWKTHGRPSLAAADLSALLSPGTVVWHDWRGGDVVAGLQSLVNAVVVP